MELKVQLVTIIWSNIKLLKKTKWPNKLIAVVASAEHDQTLGKYSVTIIIGLLWVTAPKNWTTFGWRIFWSNASSSLNAFLKFQQDIKTPETKGTIENIKSQIRFNTNKLEIEHHNLKQRKKITNDVKTNPHFLLISKNLLSKCFNSNFNAPPRCYTKCSLC